MNEGMNELNIYNVKVIRINDGANSHFFQAIIVETMNSYGLSVRGKSGMIIMDYRKH